MRATKQKEPLTMDQRRLVSENIDLAKKLAAKRKNPYVSPEDRLQDAYLGLIDAARSFKPELGLEFNTFAGHRIIGAMIDAERWTSSHIRVPRRAVEQGAVSPKVVSAGAAIHGRQYDAGADDLTLSDVVFVAPEPAVSCDDVDAIDTALSSLPVLHRKIVEARYGDGGSQAAAARAAGVSESRVSQLMPGIIERLRNHTALACYATKAAS